MFWSKDKNHKKQNRDKRTKGNSNSESKNSVGTTSDKSERHKGQRTREELEARALADMQAARDNLGNDTIQKIAKIMKTIEENPVVQAKNAIDDTDEDRILDELKWMIDNKQI